MLPSIIPPKYMTLHGHLECSQETYLKTENRWGEANPQGLPRVRSTKEEAPEK